MKPRNARIALFVLILVLVAGAGGRASVAAGSGSVSNGKSFAVSSSIGKGATLAGPVTWTASPSGAKAAKIEFSIDGQLRWKESSAPYRFNGDPNGVLDTSTLSNGAHNLAVKAYAVDGRTALTSTSVTVANSSVPATTAPTLPGSMPAPSGQAQVGQTLTAATGTWVGTQPIAYGYQWLRCDPSGANCTGITNSNASHTLTSADTGVTLRVVVTASNGFGGASATSAATAIVQTSSTTTTTTTSWTGFVGHDAYRTSDFAQIAASGVKRVRMDNPSASAITAAATYGINVLPIAGYEPWPDLNGGKGDKYPPLPQYYQTWANRMIAQWSSLPNPPVAIEVWNEPWLPDFWQPMPDPSAYYNLVKVFATEAWKVWPNVKILVSADTAGSTNTTGTILWRKNVLAADATGFLNDPRIQPTTHNYVESRTPTTVTSQPCFWDLDRFKCTYKDFKAHGHPDPQVWVTEYGWESDVVGEQKQANYTTQALSIFKNSGMVAAAYSFLYKTGDQWSYNWLRPDNSAKPVVSAVKTLITGA
jgi:Big-like domain-containing protein